MKKISTIILDWAGTTIDYGCFAPVDAFMTAFKAFGLTPSIEETRAPMGMGKRAHIEAMLKEQRLADLWLEQHGNPPTQDDIDAIYARFEPALFEVLPEYVEPLPEVLNTIAQLKDMGLALGSTTGYTQKMMDVVVPLVKEKGYEPDSLVCPDETGEKGRPFPYMLWRNLEKLGTTSIQEVIKIGDTTADMLEGKNAGCISVGILKGSSMVGLNEKELNSLTEEQTAKLFEEAKQNYLLAGADYVLPDFSKLPRLIALLNEGSL